MDDDLTLEDLASTWVSWGSDWADALLYLGVPIGFGVALLSVLRIYQLATDESGQATGLGYVGPVLGICIGGLITIFPVVTAWFSQIPYPF